MNVAKAAFSAVPSKLAGERTFSEFLRGASGGSLPEIVSWTEGTPAKIRAMLDAWKNGLIDITENWSVGEKRSIHHNAITTEWGGEAQAAGDHEWAIIDFNTADHGVYVAMTDWLPSSGVMNNSATNEGSWRDCIRRTFANGVFRESLSDDPVYSLFKPMNVITGVCNSDELITTQDYFALFAENEVYGKYDGNYSPYRYGKHHTNSENNALTRFSYYANEDNIPNCEFWFRSPDDDDTDDFAAQSSSNQSTSHISYSNYWLVFFGYIS